MFVLWILGIVGGIYEGSRLVAKHERLKLMREVVRRADSGDAESITFLTRAHLLASQGDKASQLTVSIENEIRNTL